LITILIKFTISVVFVVRALNIYFIWTMNNLWFKHDRFDNHIPIGVHAFLWYNWLVLVVNLVDLVSHNLQLVLWTDKVSNLTYGYSLVELILRWLEAFHVCLRNKPRLRLIISQGTWMYENILLLSLLYIFRGIDVFGKLYWDPLWRYILMWDLLLISAYGLKALDKVKETLLSHFILLRLGRPLEIGQFLVDRIDLGLRFTWLLNNESGFIYLIILIVWLVQVCCVLLENLCT